MTDTASHAKPLTAVDRCDRCGAQAYVKIAVPFENEKGDPEIGELLLCGHDFTTNAEHITMRGYVVVEDNREALLVKPGIGDPDDNGK